MKRATELRLRIRNRKGRDENVKENGVRICEKYALTVTEAAAYFGIGEKKLRSMIEDYSHMGLFIQNGVKYMIKRQKFEAFLNEVSVI